MTNRELQIEAEKAKARINALERSLGVMERAIQSQELEIRHIMEGIGGAVWRTKEGHARGLALLSSEHLNNIIGWHSVSAGIREKCQTELDRREIDALWREAEEHKEIELELGKSRYATKRKPKRKPAKRIRQPIPKYKSAKRKTK